MNMTCKWTFKERVKLPGDEPLARLLQFYVWETPVKGVSQKGRLLREYGWEGPNIRTLQARMRECSGFPDSKGRFWVGCTCSEVEGQLKDLDRLDGYDCSFEFAVHTERNSSKTEGLFCLIRNSFAHGSFRINRYGNQRYIAMENRHEGKLKGRAIIKEETLLEWIKIVKKDPKS